MEEKSASGKFLSITKTTILGGIAFLIPVIIATAIFGKALQILKLIGDFCRKLLPVDSVIEVLLINVMAALLLALVCFVCGLIARGQGGGKFFRKIDSTLHAIIPGYSFVKGMTSGLEQSNEMSQNFKPVLVHYDDNSQMGFEIERTSKGIVAVYIPGSPSPWSGAVLYFENSRVTALDISVPQAIKMLQHLGRGSAQYEEQIVTP